ncbi:guanylate kinase [Desulforegula conservatrix]|uniref:guanylate kinase n=1 Tax=Desulforegula conservatrix TaxID=153026 RepID=UPI00041ADE71|nr:guanylate kinase [Desulforegula conservatrix]
MTSKNKGVLFVISAPSGAGKSTLIKVLMQNVPDLIFSVSHTTRAPRAGESHGRDYFFVDKHEFEDMIETGRLAEWAKVHDNYYGTSRAFIEENLSSGAGIILDIDVQGKELIEKVFPECVTIFIMPPSIDVLRQRLSARGTETPESIAKRMGNAEIEISKTDSYKHIVINDDLDVASEEIINIVSGYMIRSSLA